MFSSSNQHQITTTIQEQNGVVVIIGMTLEYIGFENLTKNKEFILDLMSLLFNSYISKSPIISAVIM